MATVSAPIEHVVVDERGVAFVAGTATKVVEVVLDKLAHGWSPEEIQRQHRGSLTLAQIHGALAYYYDHQQALDAVIERDFSEYQKLRAANQASPILARLRAKGLLQ